MRAKIGFIGCGHMGGAMAARLIDKGHSVVVMDRDAEVLKPLAASGAEIASTPRAVADMAEVVFACLPSREASLSVASAVAGGKSINIYVESSTLGQATIDIIVESLTKSGKIGRAHV